ncbi:hypothetical protein GCM10011374_06950 [Kocuria dechangensis]|uniref:Uncharacterized protein n=1 Tax=Kocuria dechangensis TaxID=1176249 RepID=A0A917GI05_9MICC|nr:hypothetical protein GCM10011374_06950 [Kocuria dechangensis]
MLEADEVQHGEDRLVFCKAQTSTQLLEEEGRRLCGPKHEDRVDLRNVKAFIEKVNGEHRSKVASLEGLERFPAFFPGAFRRQGL